MPSQAERPPSRLLMASVAALVAIGFGLTLLIFYPGIMTFDAKFVYEDIAKGTYGDWQSPVMVWLWGLIDPIAPGSLPPCPASITITQFFSSFGSVPEADIKEVMRKSKINSAFHILLVQSLPFLIPVLIFS